MHHGTMIAGLMDHGRPSCVMTRLMRWQPHFSIIQTTYHYTKVSDAKEVRLGALQPGVVAYNHRASDRADDREASVVGHQLVSVLVGHCINAPMPIPAEEDDDPRVITIKRGDAGLRLLLDGVAVCTHGKVSEERNEKKGEKKGTH